MRTLLIFCPALVVADEHVEMVRVQSMLRDRLEKFRESDDLLIVNVVAYDGVSPRYLDQLLDLDFTFKIWEHQIERAGGCGRPRGVRRPTNYCIDVLVKCLPHTLRHGDLYLLRIIQDTFVIDGKKFLEEIDRLARPQTGRFLAGKLARSTIDSHHLAAMGLKWVHCIEYTHGEVLLAPAEIWRQYYLPLPDQITHYTDDVLMSEWLTQEGGKLVGLTDTYSHLHACPLDRLAQLRDLYASD